MRLLLAVVFISILLAMSTNAAGKVIASGSSDGQAFQVRELVDDLQIPWGMAFIADNQLLVTERGGAIKLINLAKGSVQLVEGAPRVRASGQGGLLDVKISPEYARDRWLYFTYSKPVKDGAATTLARAKLKGLQLESWQDLLVTQSASGSGQHFGSRIAFDDKGHVFFSVGDRGDRDNGQNTRNHAATIIRLKIDGSIPVNNPFVGSKTVLPEIWSYGHRNPQGLAFDARNKRLWAIEHGPRGGDELNLAQAGKNYGWPVISYGKEYWGPIAVGEGTHKQGMEQPVKYYVPSIAPSSLLLYQGKAFPKWQGNLFAGALAMTHLNRIVLNNAGDAVAEQRLLEDLDERIRNVIEDAQGNLILSTDSGRILRLEPKG